MTCFKKNIICGPINHVFHGVEYQYWFSHVIIWKHFPPVIFCYNTQVGLFWIKTHQFTLRHLDFVSGFVCVCVCACACVCVHICVHACVCVQACVLHAWMCVLGVFFLSTNKIVSWEHMKIKLTSSVYMDQNIKFYPQTYKELKLKCQLGQLWRDSFVHFYVQ